MYEKELEGKFRLRFYFPGDIPKNIVIEMRDNAPSHLLVTDRSSALSTLTMSYYHQATVMCTCAPKSTKGVIY